MANIPIERTDSGTPWWVWLLGVLLLALLLWFLIGLFGDDDDDVAVVDDPVETVGPVVTDPVVASALDLSTLYVTRVPGDSYFYVAATEGGSDETLVLLDENMSPGVVGIEGQVDINPGQMVDLSGGSIGELGDEDLAGRSLSSADMDGMSSTSNVIRIDGGDVEIYEADMDNVEVGE